MPVVIATLVVGATLIYSALTGKSLAEIFTGDVGEALDPQGAASDFDTGKFGGGTFSEPPPSASDPLKTPGTGGLPGVAPGTTIIDGQQVANWIAPIVFHARRNGWKGRITDGYRPTSDQADACRRVCGNPNGCPGTCAAPGQSNHRGTEFPLGAVDLTDPVGFERAIANYPGTPTVKNRLPNDRIHFSYTGT